MIGTYIFNYLLFPLPPLITYLFWKIRLFAPQSKYVDVPDARPTPTDLIFSTTYLEMYAPHDMAVAVLISVSILSILHISYFIYAVRQPSMTVKLPWKTERQASTSPKNERALAGSRTTTGREFMGLNQSQLPQHSVDHPSLMNPFTIASDKATPEDIPQSAHLRDITSFRSRHGKDKRRGTADVDNADWKTVYCEEWADR